MLMCIYLLLFAVSSVYSTDYYELLGISKDADSQQIRKAFKKLALKFHPDKNKDEPGAHGKFIELNKAYEVLKDEEKRKQYDLYGENGLNEDFNKFKYHSWTYYKESFGIYDDDPEIITLSGKDFAESVTGSSVIWFINFYSPQCSHCHHLAPAWRQVAKELEDVIRIGAVNCEDDWMLCRQQNIYSYPSLMLYPQVEKYEGSRDADAIIEYILMKLPYNVIQMSSVEFPQLVSRPEHANLPWLIVSCKDFKNCIQKDDVKKLGIVLEHLVNIAEVDSNDDGKICDIINCDSAVTYYSSLSNTLQENIKNSISIEEIETKEIVQKVLHFIPEPNELTDKDFEEMRKKLESKISSPWLIEFTERIDDSAENIDLKRLRAFVPEVHLGHVNCHKFHSICASLYIHKYPVFVLFKSGGIYEIHHGRITVYDVAKFAQEGISSQVQTLNPENFPEITESGETWFIDFFAPWCPPCMQLLPEWRKASQQLGHLVKFGTVDCVTHMSLCQKHNIKSYPTAVLYNKSVPHTLHGSHSHHEIEEFVQIILHPLVISLSPVSFENLKKNKNFDDIWVIDFFAPWCGPCQQLAPQWRKLAKALSYLPSVHIGEVDCQNHQPLCHSEGISSYPTIRLYPIGSMKSGMYYSYADWSRDSSSLQMWILNFLPSKVQLLSASEFHKVLLDYKPWLIDFFAPWCSHCHRFAFEFEKISEVLEDKVVTGKINCDELPKICRLVGIRAYPTVIFYRGHNDGKPQGVNGEEVPSLSYEEIIAFIEEKLNIKFQSWHRRHDEL